jgi:hypothetical protein
MGLQFLPVPRLILKLDFTPLTAPPAGPAALGVMNGAVCSVLFPPAPSRGAIPLSVVAPRLSASRTETNRVLVVCGENARPSVY